MSPLHPCPRPRYSSGIGGNRCRGEDSNLCFPPGRFSSVGAPLPSEPPANAQGTRAATYGLFKGPRAGQDAHRWLDSQAGAA